jgi:hypothetical protein
VRAAALAVSDCDFGRSRPRSLARKPVTASATEVFPAPDETPATTIARKLSSIICSSLSCGDIKRLWDNLSFRARLTASACPLLLLFVTIFINTKETAEDAGRLLYNFLQGVG